jgi:ribosomal protein S18 acetylase RimI-like enzyme
VQRGLKRRNYFIFVAVEDREIVGTITVHLRGRTKGSIDDAYVKPAFRRRGVIRALEERAVQLLREHGASTAEFNVRADNEEGMGTWPVLGYEPYKIVMKKRI